LAFSRDWLPGVTDGPDNDHAAQAAGALSALKKNALVVIHIEAPDEAAHSGAIDDKVAAIQGVDAEVVSRLRSWQVVSRLRSWQGAPLRVLIMPDHATPIQTRTHSPEPVPFLLWGQGVTANGAKRFTEAEAMGTGVFVEEGYNMMRRLVGEF